MEKKLANLGLSKKEVCVYLALLSLGRASATELSKLTNIKRPTTYTALESLEKMGLISQELINKKRLFKAEAPEKLNKLTKKMRRQVIEAELELEEILPELKNIQKTILEAPKVNFYHGLSGLKNILSNASECAEPWYFFGSAENIIKELDIKDLEEFVQETIDLRRKAGLPKAHIITDKGIFKFKHFNTPKPSDIREIKILPSLKARSALMVYSNKLAVLNFKDTPFGAVIESSEIADIVKMMYLIIWQNL